MEEHKKSKSKPLNPDQKWYTSTWFITVCIIAIAITTYFLFSRMYASKKVFTQYGNIKNDSTNQDDRLAVSFDETDTSKVILLDSTVIDTQEESNPDGTLKPSVEESIFKVNTTYSKIETDPSKNLLGEEVLEAPSEGGLFEELLLPENPDETFENLFNGYAQEKIISSKSLIKILSIAAKPILFGDNTADDRALLEAITESDNVVGILIADRKGRIVYATNRKHINRSLIDILPKLEITSDKLSWYQEDLQSVVSLPIFHTYGKIGWAVLITE